MNTCDDSFLQRWVYNQDTWHIGHGDDCIEAGTPNLQKTPVFLAECVQPLWRQEWELSTRESPTMLLSVETRNSLSLVPVRGVPGRSFHNIGTGATWEGFVSKVQLYSKAVKARAAKNPHEVLILMDSDVANGGCSESELLDRYQKIVSTSGGAPIVVSADSNQFPPIKGGIQAFQTKSYQDRRAAVMNGFGLPADALEPFCARHWGGAVALAIDYIFVNSGFIMGPARNLSEVLECMDHEGWDQECLKAPTCEYAGGLKARKVAGVGKQCCFDDQRALSICALKRPDQITIDYTGSIMQTTYGMYNMFEADKTGVTNQVVGLKQCFIHANAHDETQPVKWDAWISQLEQAFTQDPLGSPPPSEPAPA